MPVTKPPHSGLDENFKKLLGRLFSALVDNPVNMK
jgi:hypothetical protein